MEDTRAYLNEDEGDPDETDRGKIGGVKPLRGTRWDNT